MEREKSIRPGSLVNAAQSWSVLDNITHAIVICDSASNVVFANDAATGLCAGGPLSTPFERAFPLYLPGAGTPAEGEADRGIRATIVSDALGNVPVRSARVVLPTREGNRTDLLVDASPLPGPNGEADGCIITMIDVSARPETLPDGPSAVVDQNLRELERERLAIAVEHSVSGVIITDRDGTIEYVNSALLRISGYTRNELIGRNPRLVSSGLQSKGFYRSMWSTLLAGEVWSGLLINKRKDGSLFEVESIISPLKNERDEIINFVSSQRDVTQERSLESQLRQRQKMEAIGTLAGGIAHDFNNILAAIIGYTELADDDLSEGSRARDYLREVFKAGMRASSLVNQILAFSHQEKQDRKPVQITAIVKDAIKMLRASIPTTIAIRQSLESKSDTVLADPTQIHQVLLNFCTNAAHAMTETGGSLKISLIDVEFDDESAALHPDLKAGPYVALSVRDTGHGIEPDIVDRIFDPFFSTKKPGVGTGMGLSVAHGIVRAHGGAITVFSEPGVGSTFNVYFPRAEHTARPKREEIYKVPGGTESILFVDDEKALTDMTRLILERLGYTVATRTSSVEALEAFKADPERYDLIITDQTMPNMTGERLAREMLKIRPELPVIICTGFSELITDSKIRAAGIRELILKPIVRTDLAFCVRRVLDSDAGTAADEDAGGSAD